MDARAGARESGRTCISCRRVRPKRELVRIVRRPDGEAAVDPAGSAPGRGAYVCRTGGCAERLRRLPGALRSRSVDFNRVRADLASMGVG